MQASEDARLVEGFAATAAESVGNEYIVVILRPWSGGAAPEGVLAPGGESGLLDEEQILQATAQKRVVLVLCTFETDDEQQSANKVLPQFCSMEHVCVIMALILPPGMRLTRELNDAIMRRYDAMVATGVDEVIMDPKPDPASLRRAVSTSVAVWELNVRRMQLMLDAEPEPATQADVDQLRTRHRRLLWESIPRVLMPHFAPLDRRLSETNHSVGKYRFVRKLESVTGNLLLAIEDEHLTRVIKVIDKDNMMTPGELESVYREYRFLSDIIRHPNVVRSLGMLHSPARVYLIFEYAGNMNLSRLLATSPGLRLYETDTLQCFQQVARGLAHCHSKGVAHRNVSLNHIVVKRDTDAGCDGYTFQIMDFFSAMVARGDSTSMTVCGSLPCIAPEMALKRPYVPRLADCWSLGIVLLEVGGGKGTLSHCLPYNPERPELATVAAAVQAYFQGEDCHAQALRSMGAVESEDIRVRLAQLLQPDPSARTELRYIVTEG